MKDHKFVRKVTALQKLCQLGVSCVELLNFAGEAFQWPSAKCPLVWRLDGKKVLSELVKKTVTSSDQLQQFRKANLAHDDLNDKHEALTAADGIEFDEMASKSLQFVSDWTTGWVASMKQDFVDIYTDLNKICPGKEILEDPDLISDKEKVMHILTLKDVAKVTPLMDAMGTIYNQGKPLLDICKAEILTGSKWIRVLLCTVYLPPALTCVPGPKVLEFLEAIEAPQSMGAPEPPGRIGGACISYITQLLSPSFLPTLPFSCLSIQNQPVLIGEWPMCCYVCVSLC